MESMLKDQVQEELDLLSAFYPEEDVITEQLSQDKSSVTVTLKLEPNTGFDQARIAATIWSKFTFGPKVNSLPLTFKYPSEAPKFEFTATKGLDGD